MRALQLTNGEYYHVYNRGVDKREIFNDKYDIARFYQSMDLFRSSELIGSIFEHSLKPNKKSFGNRVPKLVKIVAYCLNPNHFHIILKQVSENGISKFMHKLGSGYASYFNEKNDRDGSLFQGRFKAKQIDDTDYLLYLSAYVNLNNRVHRLGPEKAEQIKSSWDEYQTGKQGICEKNIILGQFKNLGEYEKYCESVLELMLKKKKDTKEIEALKLE